MISDSFILIGYLRSFVNCTDKR